MAAASFNDRKNDRQITYHRTLMKCLSCKDVFETPTQREANSVQIALAKHAPPAQPTPNNEGQRAATKDRYLCPNPRERATFFLKNQQT